MINFRNTLKLVLKFGSASKAAKCKPKNWGPGPKFTPVRGLWAPSAQGCSLAWNCGITCWPFLLQNPLPRRRLSSVEHKNLSTRDLSVFWRFITGVFFQCSFFMLSVVPFAARKKGLFLVLNLPKHSACGRSWKACRRSWKAFDHDCCCKCRNKI